MKNSKKGFATPLIIAIIAILVISGGLYVYKNSKEFAKCNKNLPFVEYNNCLNTSAVNENNLEICNKASTSGAKYSCITNYAKEKEDINACNNLPEFDNQGCIMGIAVKIKDLNLCKTLKSNDYQVSCQTQIQNKSAVESGDEQVCENMVGQSSKDKCYAGVAIEKGNVGICEKVVAVAYNTSCYIQIAKNKNDSRICNLIKNSPDKELCLKELPLPNLTNWKTYINETYGYEYEVKYPPILSVAGKGSFANPSAINTPGSGIAFSIANENLLKAKGNEYLEYKGEIIIDGYKAKKYSRPLYIGSTTTGTLLYIVPEKNITIFYYPYGAENHKISELDMNQILSTFRFTK